MVDRYIPEPPKRPLDPRDIRVNFMRASQGPFKCGNCHYFNGDGKKCAWVNENLKADDCCNQYLKK